MERARYIWHLVCFVGLNRKKNAQARYAPIVLVPIDIMRKSAGRGYAMQMRDEDSQINITLLEFLKQNYEITIPA